MKVLPLGAGQEVGRSCIIVKIKEKTIMFDCGTHLGLTGASKYPAFSLISKSPTIHTSDFSSFDLSSIDLVILTHFHLDHCGALPLLYRNKYHGKVVMSTPTRCVLPFVLEDYCKLNVTNYGMEDVNVLMRNVVVMDVGMVGWVDGIGIRVFSAGHVLGAAMFYVWVGGESVLYTGDYTTGGDVHLDGCCVDTEDFLVFGEDLRRNGEDVVETGVNDVRRNGEDVVETGVNDVRRNGEDVVETGVNDVRRNGEDVVETGVNDVRRNGEDVVEKGVNDVRRNGEDVVEKGVNDGKNLKGGNTGTIRKDVNDTCGSDLDENALGMGQATGDFAFDVRTAKKMKKQEAMVLRRLKRPDVMITECTYGSVDRECRKTKIRELITTVVQCIERNGKVLIPVFAIGRAQEMYTMLSAFFKNANLNVPFFYCSTILERGLKIYKRFDDYTKKSFHFDFDGIRMFKNEYLVSDKPFIVFSSPGMLHTGNSLKIFKALCEDARNLVIIPGYCMKNTLAEKLLNGIRTITLDREYTIRIQVRNIGFSAHADSSGILRFIAKVRPRNVVLVHGDKNRMVKFKRIIEKMCVDEDGFDFRCHVFMPRNKCLVDLPGKNEIILKSRNEIKDDEIAVDVEQDGTTFVAKKIKKYVVRK
ncbi:hypothetical protein VCUG_01079 [Vavraia culicis subsp. floridensis]|uniref:Metallo-beta-lactamase domain-containing protein n=1 Tax=Vavraia culicis (isolate floridensis) TaxID=948595 RepID=L2GVX7_VAVCU|nr:uncharacterized protein VCUG_01079 [Vavraia culicis subsp. floridensis]ELA47428.1 hypothetical protein VCUG_01079 [Vavraia culicis subsp. floridensis]